MNKEDIKKEGIAFFSEAITKWNRLLEILGIMYSKKHEVSLHHEGNEILSWFQDNYSHFSGYSNFRIQRNIDGKKCTIDPVFDVVFSGVTAENICHNLDKYRDELFMGVAQLRGHLSKIKRQKETNNNETSVYRLETIFNRFHLVANQLKRRRKNKAPYLIEDEYDVQNLLLALLRIDFDDVRKEDWAPSYAGGASRIDFVLKSEGVLIEVKKANQNLREKQIGEQLLVDIEKYKEYPNVSTLFCFIYDPDNWIENPRGFEQDLEKCSVEKLKVIATICPRT